MTLFLPLFLLCANKSCNTHAIGGSRGGVPGARPPKGPDSFVFTYKIFET